MIWARIKAGATNAWTAYHMWITAGAVVLLLIFGVLFKDWIGAKWREWDNRAFHSQIEQLDNKIASLETENNKLRGERDAALGQVKTVELERDGLKLQYEAFGKAGEAAVKAQEQVNRDYEAKQESINNTISAYDNCINLWTARRDTGYPIQQSKDQFCARFVGR